MTDVLLWMLTGLIIGTTAKVISPERKIEPILATIGVSVGGALIGGFLGRFTFGYGVAIEEYNASHPRFWMSLFLAITVSTLSVAAFRKMRGVSLHA